MHHRSKIFSVHFLRYHQIDVDVAIYVAWYFLDFFSYEKKRPGGMVIKDTCSLNHQRFIPLSPTGESNRLFPDIMLIRILTLRPSKWYFFPRYYGELLFLIKLYSRFRFILICLWCDFKHDLQDIFCLYCSLTRLCIMYIKTLIPRLFLISLKDIFCLTSVF